MSPRTRRLAQIAFGLAVTAVFVWLIARKVDLGQMRAAFAHLRLGVAAWGLLALAAAYAVRIRRWQRMLAALGAGVTYLATARAFLSGTAINNVVPLRAGDAARVVLIARHSDFPMSRVLSSLIVERLLDVCVLLILLFAMLLLMPAHTLPGWMMRSSEWLMGIAVTAAIAILAGPKPAMRLIERFVTPVSPKIGAVVHNIASAFADLARPALMAELFAYSVVSWGLEGLLYVAFVAAAQGREPVAAGFTTFALGTLSTLIPSGPGFVGTFDMFAIIALQIFAIGANTAAVIAVSIHATLWVVTTAAGACFLVLGRSLFASKTKAG